jgi:ligand-binding sensor domain-containing protein
MNATGLQIGRLSVMRALGILFFIGHTATAQISYDGVPYIRNYTRQEYNSSPFNWCIVQDARGIVYVANNYHLLEFDGNSWRNMPLPNRTVIRSLAIDNKGFVYVGGQADFGYLAPDKKGELSFVSLKSKIDERHNTFADVWKILVTDQGIAFCTSAGIYLLQNDTIRFYKIDTSGAGLLSFFYISDRLFVCTQHQGIFELKNGSLVNVPQSEEIASYYITGMLQAPGNKILVVTQQHGIYSYDGYSSFEKWAVDTGDFLKGNVIVCAASTSSGYVLGSSHNGLLMISKDGKPITHLNTAKGLQNNGIEYIYPDNNGNLWLALRDGIDYIEINSPFTIFNSKSGISGSGFTSWVEDNKVYLGTSEGLYYKKWSNDNHPLREAEFKLVEGSQGQTYNLQKIDNLLLLTHNNGVFQVRDDRVERIGDQTGAWLFVPLLTHPGYLICGAYTGLFLYRIEDDNLKFVRKIGGFEQSSRIIEQDTEGNIWIAHGYLGLYKVKLTADLESTEKVEFYNSKSGFPSNVFINVFKVNNELVFTGERGIYRYDKSKDAFEPHEVFDNLITNTNHTRKLIEDKEGNIWFSSADELGVLKKRNGRNYEVTKTIFNKLQRRLVGGFEHFAYYDPNNVIIGTDEGFVHFNPSHIVNSDHTFATVIRKVEITSEKDSLLSSAWFSASSLQASVQPDNEKPVLPYALNALRFTYSATSYEDAPKVQYQYKLEGYDANWSSWTGLTSKEYTNLKEGDYTFLVKSRDIYNHEGTTVSYKFSILPPWYRTLWAYIIYAVLALVVLYLVSQYTKREQQKTMRLKEIQHHEEVLKVEKEIIKLNNEKLENELSHKNRELASSAMHIVHNVDTMQKIKTSLLHAIDVVHDNEAKAHLRKVLRSIASEMTMENNWEQFELHFNQIHEDFLVRIRKEFPDLTHSDIRLISYLKLNLSSKEIAPLLNLTVRGVEASRYRIRKKLNLSPNVNLTEFILKY